MARFLMFIQGWPLTVMVIGAHFVLYSFVAWPVLLGRAVCGRFTRRETAVFAFFALFLLLEWFQLKVDGFDFLGRNVYGLPRYFGTFAPFLWLWLAKALATVWGGPRPRGWRVGVRVALALGLGALFVFQGVMTLADIYRTGAIADSQIAATTAAEIIRADYAGPARQGAFRRSFNEYFTTRRPVVFSDFSGLAAWRVGGQSEGANFGHCPYPPDYVFRRATIDPKKGTASVDIGNRRNYDFLKIVRGLEGLGPRFDPDGQGSVWMLFRRKGVPCRKDAP